MKKVLIVLLVAAVAMTAVFANTSDKDGFSIKVSPALFGNIGAAYRMGDFEFEVDYISYGPVMSIQGLSAGAPVDVALMYLVYPLGGEAQVGYKFIATDMHELEAIVRVGYNIAIGFIAGVGVEYDFCFNDNHAVYARLNLPLYPFITAIGSIPPESIGDMLTAFFLFDANIGYRYTF